MKLVVGLGNPGKEYRGTRHNVGFMTVEALASKLHFPDFQLLKKFKSEVASSRDAIFVKPQTFMNRSGQAVQAIAHFYKVDPGNIWVIHDDLDIQLGEYKFSERGPKVHNGVNSVSQSLGSDEFTKVRIGVDNRNEEGRKIPGERYVLSRFSREEQDAVERVINDVVAELVDSIVQ